MSGVVRGLTLVLIVISFVFVAMTLNLAYHRKLEQINAVGRQNIEGAVMWQTLNSLLDSGIIDDIAQFTVDYVYLGDYPFGNGRTNYINFRNQILSDYQGLINVTKLLNVSFALFIDDKLIYINGGTVSYSGNSAPYSIEAVYSPIVFWFITLPNWELYAVYNLSNARFYDSTYGYIENATKLPPTPSTLNTGYCIYVVGTKGNGTICYKREMTLPYVVETENKWGGYNLTIYWGEVVRK